MRVVDLQTISREASLWRLSPRTATLTMPVTASTVPGHAPCGAGEKTWPGSKITSLTLF